ncbi:MAG: hypothetical protein HYY16_08885 [Planctomycetes bacterium]|nr:hypothetical protein [Planctomycetota bacterium]
MGSVLRTAFRVLFFMARREELLALDRRHLIFGMVMTWLAGIGRYWDHPQPHLAQQLGLGSVIYVVVLSAGLWKILSYLRPYDWSITRLLTFVTLTSPPAILYAIPVERFMAIETARSVNMTFLAVVATWRVALLFFYLRRLAQLDIWSTIVGTLLPLTLIVTALTLMNVQQAVFDLMGGLYLEGPRDDDAYPVLLGLTTLSVTAFPVLAIAYVILCFRDR